MEEKEKSAPANTDVRLPEWDKSSLILMTRLRIKKPRRNKGRKNNKSGLSKVPMLQLHHYSALIFQQRSACKCSAEIIAFKFYHQ
jgi:hypothetical protein